MATTDQTAVADKLRESLKAKIIKAYSSFVIKAQRGHPLDGYEPIMEAITVIDFIKDFEIDAFRQIQLFDNAIVKLSNG